MRSIVFVNTVYQFFIVINMQLNHCFHGEVDVVLSDHTPSLKNYMTGLKTSGLFKNVFYMQTMQVHHEYNNILWGERQKQNDSFRSVIEKYASQSGLDFNQYDFIYTANLGIFSMYIHYFYPNLAFYMFEDGGSVCYYDFPKFYNKWFSNNQSLLKLLEDIRGLYLYSPDLMLLNLGYDFRVLPPVEKNNPEIVKLYNNIFDYDISFRFPKVVFVEQSYSVDKIENNEIDFMKAAGRIVGYNDFIVKPHPRNVLNPAFTFGLSRSTNCPWPFEITLMNNAGSESIFITVCSGSLLSPRILFGDDLKTILLYKALSGKLSNEVNDLFHTYLDRFVEKFKSPNLIIPNSFYGYIDILNGLLNKNACLPLAHGAKLLYI